MKKVFALLLLTCFSVYLVSPGMCEVLVVDVKKVNQNKNVHMNEFMTLKDACDIFLDEYPQYRNAFLSFSASLSDSDEGYDISVMYYDADADTYVINIYDLCSEGGRAFICARCEPLVTMTVQEYLSCYTAEYSIAFNAKEIQENYMGPWQFWSAEEKALFTQRYGMDPTDNMFPSKNKSTLYTIPDSENYTESEAIWLSHEAIKNEFGLSEEQINMLGEDIRFIGNSQGGCWNIHYWVYINTGNELLLAEVLTSYIMSPKLTAERGFDEACLLDTVMDPGNIPLLFCE